MKASIARPLAMLIALSAMGMAGAAIAQSPESIASAVGLPGCAGDVGVAASRTRITFSSDGREVPALLYEPEGPTRAGAALVIMHGRSIEEDLVTFDAHALQFASRGYMVIMPFYLQAARDHDDTARARTAHRIWRGVALDAALAVADESGIGPDRVLLWGNTRGGGVALAAALQPGSPVGGAVGVRIGGSPQDDAQGTGRPFLLIHPVPSRSLPPEIVRGMAAGIRERGGDVTLLEIPDGDGAFRPADWCRTMEGTRELLERVALSRPLTDPAQ